MYCLIVYRCVGHQKCPFHIRFTYESLFTLKRKNKDKSIESKNYKREFDIINLTYLYMGRPGKPFRSRNILSSFISLSFVRRRASALKQWKQETLADISCPQTTQAAFHLGPGWAPVGQSWAPNGPRMGLTGAHLGMLLG